MNVNKSYKAIKNGVLFKLLLVCRYFKKTPLILKNTAEIEYMLSSFGIKTKVVAVDFEEKSNLFCLKIAYGVRVEEIEKLSKTIALGVASKTGKVEIIAPVPGTSYVGIRVPKEKS